MAYIVVDNTCFWSYVDTYVVAVLNIDVCLFKKSEMISLGSNFTSDLIYR